MRMTNGCDIIIQSKMLWMNGNYMPCSGCFATEQLLQPAAYCWCWMVVVLSSSVRGWSWLYTIYLIKLFDGIRCRSCLLRCLVEAHDVERLWILLSTQRRHTHSHTQRGVDACRFSAVIVSSGRGQFGVSCNRIHSTHTVHRHTGCW